MENEKNTRPAEDLGNLQRGECEKSDSQAIATLNDTATEDEKARSKALKWRMGKSRVWDWWVDCLEERLSSGRNYASMRSFTDDAGQNHDFLDDFGRKVSVPHDKGLGRGIALLMVEEHPEFGRLFRMRGAR